MAIFRSVNRQLNSEFWLGLNEDIHDYYGLNYLFSNQKELQKEYLLNSYFQRGSFSVESLRKGSYPKYKLHWVVKKFWIRNRKFGKERKMRQEALNQENDEVWLQSNFYLDRLFYDETFSFVVNSKMLSLRITKYKVQFFAGPTEIHEYIL